MKILNEPKIVPEEWICGLEELLKATEYIEVDILNVRQTYANNNNSSLEWTKDNCYSAVEKDEKGNYDYYTIEMMQGRILETVHCIIRHWLLSHVNEIKDCS